MTRQEDEHCVNLIGRKTAKQMELITIRNYQNKPCAEPVGWAFTANVNVNLTSSREFVGLTLEHVRSQYKDVFDGFGSLGTPLGTIHFL